MIPFCGRRSRITSEHARSWMIWPKKDRRRHSFIHSMSPRRLTAWRLRTPSSTAVWGARFLSMSGRRRLLGSFWHGSMANAMAQSIGAQKAFPNRQVVSFSGDGGFTMLMGDFLSLAQLGLPVKVIVFNNGALSFIELEQRATGFLSTGTDLKNPNFAAMAEAVGIRGIRIEHPSEVEPAIADALAHDGPVLVDAVVNRAELSMPPKITAAMAKGFPLYMLKAILNGQGSEIVELATTNLLR